MQTAAFLAKGPASGDSGSPERTGGPKRLSNGVPEAKRSSEKGSSGKGIRTDQDDCVGRVLCCVSRSMPPRFNWKYMCVDFGGSIDRNSRMCVWKSVRFLHHKL
jgi:hypothetical protein